MAGVIVGTPRPSATILGEVEDNGFFLKNEEEEEEGSVYDNPEEHHGEEKRGRARSAGLGDLDMNPNEVSETPPISLTGTQPVLRPQLLIVTDLLSHSASTGYFVTSNPNPHLLPPHFFARPNSNRVDQEELALTQRRQLDAELALEREEEALLAKYRQGGLRGRPSPADGTSPSASRRHSSIGRRRSSLTRTAPPVQSPTSNLLPPFEERLRLISLVNGTSKTAETRTQDFVVELDDHHGGERRVHCQIIEFSGPVEDAVFDALAKSSDGIVVNQDFSESTLKALSRALASAKGAVNSPLALVVISKLFGANPVEAKQNCQKLGDGCYFVMASEFSVELVVRNALIKAFRTQEGKAGAIPLLEKQLKHLEKRAAGGKKSPCVVM